MVRIARNLPAAVVDQLAALQSNGNPKLATTCRDWLNQLPDTAELVEVSGPTRSTPVTLDDLQQVREHIVRLKARSANASTRQQDLVERAHGWVVTHATPPTVRTLDSHFDVSLPSSPIGILCWLFPSQVAAALVIAAREDPDQQIIAGKARIMAMARQQSEILEVERIEEQFVRKLIDDGVAVNRRADASPAAVLLVTVRQ